MKTPEEIKKGLECCNMPSIGCRSCPYQGDCDGQPGLDALAYIKQLEERIDMLMLQLRGDCDTCKNRKCEYTCRVCCDDEYAYHPLWEYEGFPSEREDDHEKPV